MKSQTSTKRAFRGSVVAVLLCVAMLIGTTFAWFTDTAGTAVNKIEAGTLKVELWKADTDEKLSAEPLKWVKAAGHENEAVLWEPGASYNLESFRIKNNGNLALKYKVVITGIVGDSDLKDAIDFTYKIGNQTLDLNAEGHLAAAAATDVITINGKMNENAGNEYQGKSIDGISITVIATQDTVEHDSFSNEYDANAKYPVLAAELKKTYGTNGLSMPSGVEITDNQGGFTGGNGQFTITLNDTEAFVYFTQVFDRAAAFEARKAQWGSEGFTKYPSEYNLATLNMWYGPYCNQITVKMGCDVDLNGMEVKPFGMSGYVFQFDGDGHTIKNAKVTAASGNAGFFMSRANVSNVVLDNIQVSALGCDSAGVVAGSPNSNIKNVTVKNSSVTGAKYTGAIAGYDYGDILDCVVENTTVSGQYKVGGVVGYVCTDNAEQQRIITGNRLTAVTVKGDSLWNGKSGFVIGKIVGNWNAKNGTCKDNTFSGTTLAAGNIGEIENGCTVQQ